MGKKLKTDDKILLCLEIQVLESSLARALEAMGRGSTKADLVVSRYLSKIEERLAKLKLGVID